MRRIIFFASVLLTALSVVTVEARLVPQGSIGTIPGGTQSVLTGEPTKNLDGSVRDGWFQKKDYLFIGKDGLDGMATREFKVCSDDSGSFESPLKNRFKQWFSDISPTAQEKMYSKGTCQLMSFQIIDKPSYRYRNVNSLEIRAQGSSAYKVEGNKLVLVKDFETNALYVVVVPQVSKKGLKLKDLRLGVTPDLKNTYRKKTASVYNYHDLKQAVYIFTKYKRYPGPYQTNSALFSGSDFLKLKKQGKFKGLVIYKLIGGELIPAK